ncbi:Fatty-acid and retinol-binding protein [Aphelenchoides besseyi]|nr:Fatty-acid and retinol-binding protein [Aphelenchoides besseyi]
MFASWVIGLTFLSALASAVNFRDLPPQFNGLYPKKVAAFYGGLSPEQEKLIDEAIMSNLTDRNAQYAAIKKKDAQLESKFKLINEEFVGNLSSLSYYANAFYYFRVLQRIELLHTPGTTEDQLNEFVADLLQDWNALSNDSKQEIQQKFPEVVQTINSQRFKSFGDKAPYIKPYLIYLIQKWDSIPQSVRDHLAKELPELSGALNSAKVRTYVNNQPISN